MATTQGERLKMLLTQLHISNRKLAAEIHIDPAMITRWTQHGFGKRKVLQSVQMISDYVSGLRLSSENIAWLCAQMKIKETRNPTSEEIMLYLAPEVEVLLPRKGQSNRKPADDRPPLIQSFHNLVEQSRIVNFPEEEGTVYVSTSRIVELLKKELKEVPAGSTVRLFISSECMDCVLDSDCLDIVRRYNLERNLHWQVLLQSGANTERIERLVNVFLPLIAKGNLQMNVLHGIPAMVSGEMKIIFPNQSVILVSEVMGGDHPVLSSITSDLNIVQAISRAFDSSLKFSRSMIDVYDDSFARKIINTFYSEYGVAGHLDVIKCGMNPLYFTAEEYGTVLRKMSHQEDQYRWRYDEFVRFKKGMNAMMRESRNREILCLPKLRQIAETGTCRMPAMYFFDSGIWNLDAEDCVNLLSGYIRYLTDFPTFQVILVDAEEPFMMNSCWHIKNNRHIMIHSWDIDDPIMVYSEEMLLIDEFQHHFESLWDKKGHGRSKRSVIEELTRLRDLCRDRFLKNATGEAAGPGSPNAD